MELTPAESALLRLVHPERAVAPDLPPAAWDTVIRLAHREQMAPLVAVTLDAGGHAEVRAALAAAHDEARSLVARAYRELAAVVRALRAEGVEVLLLKGAALAAFTYPAPALRPFADLDVLVRPADIDGAGRALNRAGYALVGETPSPADRRWRHARGYYDPAGRRLPVDLHWRYAGYPHLLEVDAAEVFARARSAALPDGTAVLLLSPADQVVELAVAFLRDIWYGKPRLRYLRDLAQVVRSAPVDWAIVEDVTARVPLRAPVYLALRLAIDLLGGAVPSGVLARLRPARGRWVVERLTSRLRRGLLRRESAWASVTQVAVIRALDARSAVEYVRWLASMLLFVPRPLRGSRRWWWRRALTG